LRLGRRSRDPAAEGLGHFWRDGRLPAGEIADEFAAIGDG
jgi:hypothetical protein